MAAPWDQTDLQVAQMSPEQRIALVRIAGARRQGEALAGLFGQGIGALTGVDVRTKEQRKQAAQEEIATTVRRLGVTDPEQVYPVMIQILQRHGLTEEALALAREFEDMRNKRLDRTLRERDIARKEQADAAKERYYLERVRILQDKNAGPEQLLETYADTVERLESTELEPGEKARLQALRRGLEARLGVKPERTAAGQWQVRVVSGNKYEPTRIIRYNTATGEMETRTETAGRREPGMADEAALGTMQPLKGVVDSQGRQVYQNKGRLFVLSENGTWEPAETTKADQSDNAAPPHVRNTIGGYREILASLQQVFELLTSPQAKKYLGIGMLANKFISLADRLQPEGVPLRAAISDLSSAIIHARSGAAVSALEFDRLRPFIPSETDSVRVAFNKLQTMYDTVTRRLNAWRQTANLKPESFPPAPRLLPTERVDPNTVPRAGGGAPASAPAPVRLPPNVTVERIN